MTHLQSVACSPSHENFFSQEDIGVVGSAKGGSRKVQIGTHELTSLSLSTYPKQPSKLIHSPHILTQLVS